MALIELRQLHKAYGAVEALRDLSLKVPEACLFGSAGSQRRRQDHGMLGSWPPCWHPISGSVEVAGVDALEDPRAVRRMLGYVAQEVAIDKILTGRELLQLQGDLYHLPIGS